jgi:hypothetical protein
VIYRCKGDIHPDLMIEILEHGTIVVLGIIDGDLLRNSVATNDILPEKFLDGGEGYVGYWLVSTHLVKYSTGTMAKV